MTKPVFQAQAGHFDQGDFSGVDQAREGNEGSKKGGSHLFDQFVVGREGGGVRFKIDQAPAAHHEVFNIAPNGFISIDDACYQFDRIDRIHENLSFFGGVGPPSSHNNLRNQEIPSLKKAMGL